MKHEYKMIVIPYEMMGKVQYLPTLKRDGVEIYRGEYQSTSVEAVERIQRRLNKEIESE